MLGKTFKGMTDEMLAWQTEKLLALEIGRDDYTVYVRPELVVEIAFNEIQDEPALSAAAWRCDSRASSATAPTRPPRRATPSRR